MSQLPAISAPPTNDLSYGSTVPRHLVHRAATAEVLLTDWRRDGERHFRCAAQWAHGHRLYDTGKRAFGALLVVETIRQAGILVAHVGFDVPDRYVFVMDRLRFDCDADSMRSPGLREMIVEVTVQDLKRRSGVAGGMRVDVDILHAGTRHAGGQGWLRCAAPAVYERIRWRGDPRRPGPPPPVRPAPAAAVGCRLDADVVLGDRDPGGFRRLRIPIDHPVFFDHELDHVPGLLVFEAMRQAAVAEGGRPGASMIAADADFPLFLELDQECRVTATALPDSSEVRLVQNGRTAAHGTVRLS